jgi:hypothetical protein
LNGDDAGSLGDPSKLAQLLTTFFHERELHRAYRPGMEHRPEVPLSGRIQKTVMLVAPAALKYGELIEFVSIVEQTGASPIVLQVGDASTDF